MHENTRYDQALLPVLPQDMQHQNVLDTPGSLAKKEAECVSIYYCYWLIGMHAIFGLLGICLLFSLMLVLAPLIYLDSPGPIFYHQERLGYKGKKFHILKFRTMCVDAEQGDQAVWATEGDARVTRVGRFLRMLHIDELPQVINILRGDMNLIGPRPERAVFVDQLEKNIPLYRHRLNVKPGLTGWAQVKFHYAGTEQEAQIKLQYDLYYIAHQSISLDIKILCMTVVEVLCCRGT